jgi:ribosome biogenesis GTPase A
MHKPLRVLICGIPNVGKSTLINTLVGKRATKTGDEPGITKTEQKIVLENGFYLFDTPGMLWPRIAIEQSGYHLAASGAIGRNAFDEAEVALELIAVLKRRYPERLRERYGLAELGEDDAVLEAIGLKRGAKIRGGAVQMHKAAEALLIDYRQGLLGRITLETPGEMAAWRQAAADEESRKAAEQEAARLADKARRSGRRQATSGDA